MNTGAPTNAITVPKANLGTLSGGRLITIPLAAGATTTLTSRGTEFYFVVATGAVNARARGNVSGAGDFVLYPQEGTGQVTGSEFDFIDLQNPNSYAIAIGIWIGYGGFIDKRLILNNVANPNVAYPTYPVAKAGTVININDLSGQAFTDIDENNWIALSRVGNPDFQSGYGRYLSTPGGGRSNRNGSGNCGNPSRLLSLFSCNLAEIIASTMAGLPST